MSVCEYYYEDSICRVWCYKNYLFVNVLHPHPAIEETHVAHGLQWTLASTALIFHAISRSKWRSSTSIECLVRVLEILQLLEQPDLFTRGAMLRFRPPHHESHRRDDGLEHGRVDFVFHDVPVHTRVLLELREEHSRLFAWVGSEENIS